MSKRKSLLIAAAVIFLLAAVLLSFGAGYARYRTEIKGDLEFGIQPLDLPEIEQIAWKQDGEGYILVFKPNRSMLDCRLYLAVSEGVTSPESMVVELSYMQDTEAIQLRAVMEPITEASGLKMQFGPGYVFRFYDPVTGEEHLMDLVADGENAYSLAVTGLDSAAEYQSLLRLFVEPTQGVVQVAEAEDAGENQVDTPVEEPTEDTTDGEVNVPVGDPADGDGEEPTGDPQ
ncbi:MAG: hypothetical protein IJ412_05130 [Oscillospiraceae bacterium]|nr:hypothetical protein [Oscillospiraceae bacterium]